MYAHLLNNSSLDETFFILMDKKKKRYWKTTSQTQVLLQPKVCLDCLAYGKLWSIKYFTRNWDFPEDGIRRALFFSPIVACLIFLTLLLLQNCLNSPVSGGPGEQWLWQKGSECPSLTEMITQLISLFRTLLLLVLINHRFLGGNGQRAHCSFNWTLPHQWNQL